VMYFHTSRDVANELFRWDNGSIFCLLISAFLHKHVTAEFVSSQLVMCRR